MINQAGGLTNNADTSVINLSKKITDEMVIIIYSKIQVKNFIKTKDDENFILNKCKKVNSEAIENDACIESNEKNISNKKININTASLEELLKIPHIGEKKAKDILNYRDNKLFDNIEQVKEIPGIGDALFAKIKENITT